MSMTEDEALEQLYDKFAESASAWVIPADRETERIFDDLKYHGYVDKGGSGYKISFVGRAEVERRRLLKTNLVLGSTEEYVIVSYPKFKELVSDLSAADAMDELRKVVVDDKELIFEWDENTQWNSRFEQLHPAIKY